MVAISQQMTPISRPTKVFDYFFPIQDKSPALQPHSSLRCVCTYHPTSLVVSSTLNEREEKKYTESRKLLVSDSPAIVQYRLVIEKNFVAFVPIVQSQQSEKYQYFCDSMYLCKYRDPRVRFNAKFPVDD